jgi:hypothetical protein
MKHREKEGCSQPTSRVLPESLSLSQSGSSSCGVFRGRLLVALYGRQ